jgi:hypothetical protein
VPKTPTNTPPAGADCAKVIVHVELPPETTVDGTHCNVETVTPAIVTEATAELPFNVAVIVAAWFAASMLAAAEKLAVLEPEVTGTDAGTLSAGLFDERATAKPPAGASCEVVTVHVAVPPEFTVLGTH